MIIEKEIELKIKEQAVQTVKKKRNERDQINFILSHGLILAGLIVTLLTTL